MNMKSDLEDIVKEFPYNAVTIEKVYSLLGGKELVRVACRLALVSRETPMMVAVRIAALIGGK